MCAWRDIPTLSNLSSSTAPSSEFCSIDLWSKNNCAGRPDTEIVNCMQKWQCQGPLALGQHLQSLLGHVLGVEPLVDVSPPCKLLEERFCGVASSQMLVGKTRESIPACLIKFTVIELLVVSYKLAGAD